MLCDTRGVRGWAKESAEQSGSDSTAKAGLGSFTHPPTADDFLHLQIGTKSRIYSFIQKKTLLRGSFVPSAVPGAKDSALTKTPGVCRTYILAGEDK